MAEKPFSDIRRERFLSSGKRAFGGKSVRRSAGWNTWNFDPQLKQVAGQKVNEKGSTDRRLLLSCLDCEGFAAGTSMHKGHAWEAVPTLLEENAVAPPQVTHT